ncbi:hypothetical protein GCM10009574_034370 [Streptomyces asiaticus]|uniref:Uncharacterized protein n=2 Tax=Streptomyces rhizosphaericus TaxID=114699 RepID=A0ABP4CUN9_9ACTN
MEEGDLHQLAERDQQEDGEDGQGGKGVEVALPLDDAAAAPDRLPGGGAGRTLACRRAVCGGGHEVGVYLLFWKEE